MSAFPIPVIARGAADAVGETDSFPYSVRGSAPDDRI